MQFDAVVNWIAFTPEDIESDMALFQGRTKQYIFISSASAYQKPPVHPVITESTPLKNPYWDYSRGQDRLRGPAAPRIPGAGLSDDHRAPRR